MTQCVVLNEKEIEALEKYRKDQNQQKRLEEIRWELIDILEECSKMGVRLVVKNRSADGSREYLSGIYGAKINHYLSNGAKEIELIH